MRSRPLGIWLITLLQIAIAVTLVPDVVAFYPGVSPVAGIELSDMWRALYVGWAVLNIVAALWLFTLSRRGWALTMVMVGVGLIANLILWYAGDPSWIRMAIQALTALYLNTEPVRRLFMQRDETATIVLRDRAGS